MKIILITFLIFTISCSSTKNTTSTSDSPSYDSYIKSVTMSESTKSLIEEIRKEIKLLQKNQKYIPSQNLINEFKIKNIDNSYFVGAILKVNDNFDNTVLEAVGVKTITKSNKNITVLIPLEYLVAVVEYSGIDYIQIDE